MTNPWASVEVSGGDYFELKQEGDSFEGTVLRKDTHTPDFKDGIPGKPKPRIYFEDEGEGEKHYVFVNSAATNAIIKLNPEIGERIRVTRGAKFPGSRAFAFDIERVDNAKDRPAPAATASKPKNDAPPF